MYNLPPQVQALQRYYNNRGPNGNPGFGTTPGGQSSAVPQYSDDQLTNLVGNGGAVGNPDPTLSNVQSSAPGAQQMWAQQQRIAQNQQAANTAQNFYNQQSQQGGSQFQSPWQNNPNYWGSGGNGNPGTVVNPALQQAGLALNNVQGGVGGQVQQMPVQAQPVNPQYGTLMGGAGGLARHYQNLRNR